MAVRPSARLSPAAIQLLVDFDRIGSGRIMDFANLQHGMFLLPIDGGASQALENIGGKGGTRTLGPGIMSAVVESR
jgi:hypothetical protein